MNYLLCVRNIAKHTVARSQPFSGVLQNGSHNLSIIQPSTVPSSQGFLANYIQCRNASFLQKRPGKVLWESVTSVSNAGKKKGGQRGQKGRIRNYNIGQRIGVGEVNMVWPGLNAPVFKGETLVKQEKLESNPEFRNKLREQWENSLSSKRFKVSPLERGYSGNKIMGRRMGPPEPVADENFEGFDTIVIECKRVTCMKGGVGRRHRTSAFCVTGNGNGLVGFALAHATMPMDAVRMAKNKAGQQLFHIKRFDDHTVMHDFSSDFGPTRVHVFKKPRGFGLVCHRVIKSICELAGIKDIYAKVELSVNVQRLTKAFFLGLIRQKSYQEMADETGLHVVEMKSENHDYPTVLASPKSSDVKDENLFDSLDVNNYTMGGRVVKFKKRHEQLMKGRMMHPGWERHLRRSRTTRNREKTMHQLRKEYGFNRSYLYDQYPECHGYNDRNYLTHEKTQN